MKILNRPTPFGAVGVRQTDRTAPSWLTLAGLSLSMLLASLGTSVANVALPTLEESFGVSFQAVQWIVLAYLLGTTTLIVSVGRLGDIIGRRRLLLLGLALFAAASMLAGLAPVLWLLIVARAFQGFGAAIMMALTLAFVGQIVPREKTGSAMGLLGTMSAVGTALGPSLGGLLIAGPGWRAIFLLNVPLTLTALVLIHRFLPADPPWAGESRPRFDATGTFLLALALAAYALAMTTGRGHFGPLNVALLLSTFIAIGLFLVIETKVAHPLLQLDLMRDSALRASLGMSTLVSTVMMATLVVGPFYLERGLALDSARVGAVMSIGPVVVALIGVPAGRMVDRLGAALLTSVGLIAMAAGAGLLALIPEAAGVPGYLGPIVVITVGYALFQTANNTAVMKNANPEQRGVISGVLNLSRNLGLITGASVMGAVFTWAAGTSHLRSAPAEAIATGMRLTFAVAAVLVGGALGVSLWTRFRTSTTPKMHPNLHLSADPSFSDARHRCGAAMTGSPMQGNRAATEPVSGHVSPRYQWAKELLMVQRIKWVFRPDFARYEGVRRINIYALRLLFALMLFVLGRDVWTHISSHQGPWDSDEAVAWSVFASFSALAILGIIRPLKMLPLVLLEIAYKVLWLILVAYPLWSNERLAGSPAEERTYAFLWVVLPILAMPWRYAFDTYVRGRMPEVVRQAA